MLRDATPVYEIPFGALARKGKDDEEEPALRWALLEAASEPKSLLVCNDCKYGHAVKGGALRVNLIRSAYEPDPLPELGEHAAALRIALVPRGAGLAAATAAGQAFNHPLLVIGTDSHSGAFPVEAALVKCTGEGIVQDCLKRAEDGNGLVVRVHNTADQAREAVLEFHPLFGDVAGASAVDLLERPVGGDHPTLQGRCVQLPVGPRAIATLRVCFRRT